MGYTPLSDVGLLAGTRLLTERHCILELGRTVELLKALQKQDPKFVRFTVDRMGALAYVKFLKMEPVEVAVQGTVSEALSEIRREATGYA